METIHVSIFGLVDYDLYATEECWLPHRPAANLHELGVTAALMRFVRTGDACIDAGANVGCHTFIMAKLAGPTGSVLALEPDPASFKKLTDNIALNEANTVTALPCGLWCTAAELDFTSVDGGGSSCLGNLLVLNGMRIEKITIKAVALDDLLTEGLPIRVLKIDCEGAEHQILLGARGLLERGVDCVLCEIHNDRLRAFSTDQFKIRGFMQDLGYSCYLMPEDCRRPEIVAPETDLFHDYKEVTRNVLFCKPDVFAAACEASSLRAQAHRRGGLKP